MRVIAAVARETIGPSMQGPVETYRALLDQEVLAYDVAAEPQVYVAPSESWTDIVVRYRVAARERRKWSSALTFASSRSWRRRSIAHGSDRRIR